MILHRTTKCWHSAVILEVLMENKNKKKRFHDESIRCVAHVWCFHHTRTSLLSPTKRSIPEKISFTNIYRILVNNNNNNMSWDGTARHQRCTHECWIGRENKRETALTVNEQSDVQYTPGACSTIWATLNHFPQQNTFLLHLSFRSYVSNPLYS